MAPTKKKGDLAELKVAAHLVSLGYDVAFPFGEDNDFDLILVRDARVERVQVKHATSDGSVVAIRCRSHSLTNGRVRRTKQYTSATIDWIGCYDATSDRCFYIPASMLGAGRSSIHLRLTPTRNNQRAKTHVAADFARPEPATASGASRIRTDDLVNANHAL